jgi:hypothetical protein
MSQSVFHAKIDSVKRIDAKPGEQSGQVQDIRMMCRLRNISDNREVEVDSKRIEYYHSADVVRILVPVVNQ